MQLSPCEKLERSFALLQIHVQNIARQIKSEHGELPEDQLKHKVAEVLYQDDPDFLNLMNSRKD